MTDSANARVKIYSKTPCPYCVHAKNLLQSKSIPYTDVNLTDQFDKMQQIKNETGWQTFPIIFIDGKLIGGFSELRQMDHDGKLEDLV